MDNSIIKRLLTSIKCSGCGQHYEGENIDILGHQEDLWFLRVFCPSCYTHCLVMAIIKEGEAPEVITDLTEAEFDKFSSIDMITSDDLLDIHNLLEDFNGDLSRLLNSK